MHVYSIFLYHFVYIHVYVHVHVYTVYMYLLKQVTQVFLVHVVLNVGHKHSGLVVRLSGGWGGGTHDSQVYMYMIISNTKQGEGHTDSEPSSLGWDSNLCPPWFSASALPTELPRQPSWLGYKSQASTCMLYMYMNAYMIIMYRCSRIWRSQVHRNGGGGAF